MPYVNLEVKNKKAREAYKRLRENPEWVIKYRKRCRKANKKRYNKLFKDPQGFDL